MVTELTLGAKLRAARAARRLSLAEVAEMTDISASFLSLVETGKSDITIGRLTRLVKFYNMSFSDLLGGADAADPEIVRAKDYRLIHSPAESVAISLLTATRRTMMSMLLNFEPGAGLAEHSRHEGEEFVHVLDGALILEIEGSEATTLEAGDSAYYSAGRPHRFLNGSSSDSLRLICVNSPPPDSYATTT